MIGADVLLVGYGCNEKYFRSGCLSDLRPQVAAYKLESRIKKGLISNGLKVESLNFFAASTYPANTKIVFKGVSQDGNQTLGFINFPFLKWLTRAFGLTYRLLFKIDKATKVVIVYSMSSCLISSVLVGALAKKYKIILVVPDLPEFMNVGVKRSRLFYLLKHIETKVLGKLVGGIDGFVFLTKHMNQALATWRNKPFVIVEGIAENQVQIDNLPNIGSEVCEFFGGSSNDIKYLLYAGAISEKYGLFDLIEAAEYFDGTVVLLICGYGDASEALKKRAELLSNVHYFGSVSKEEVAFISSKVHAFINPRPAEGDYVKYSFPSKTLEYMMYGKPVITTPLPGIPDEYDEYLFKLKTSQPKEIARLVNFVLTSNAADVESKGRKAKYFVETQKTAEVQGRKIATLINQIQC